MSITANQKIDLSFVLYLELLQAYEQQTAEDIDPAARTRALTEKIHYLRPANQEQEPQQ